MTRMRTVHRIIGLAAIVAASSSCGDALLQSRAPVLLVIDSLQAAQGNKPAAFFFTLTSDVITQVTIPSPCIIDQPCTTLSTVFNDLGQATMHLNAKQQPTTNNPFGPTSTNEVTITRYHVAFVRADGRNTPGVDVPFAFDGAVTATIGVAGSVAFGFELVRHVAKEESPLVQLANSATIITTIAQVTFYGHDTVGNAISVTGSLTVDFGNFGD